MTERPLEVLRFEIAKLGLAEGDVLVFRYPADYTERQIAELAKTITRCRGFGCDRKVVVMPDSIELSVVAGDRLPPELLQ